jgi:hypothetical protein
MRWTEITEPAAARVGSARADRAPGEPHCAPYTSQVSFPRRIHWRKHHDIPGPPIGTSATDEEPVEAAGDVAAKRAHAPWKTTGQVTPTLDSFGNGPFLSSVDTQVQIR